MGCKQNPEPSQQEKCPWKGLGTEEKVADVIICSGEKITDRQTRTVPSLPMQAEDKYFSTNNCLIKLAKLSN